eukprot:COSAG05_NODE_3777_length_1842_cov_2.272519_3_plen_146_part_00
MHVRNVRGKTVNCQDCAHDVCCIMVDWLPEAREADLGRYQSWGACTRSSSRPACTVVESSNICVLPHELFLGAAVAATVQAWRRKRRDHERRTSKDIPPPAYTTMTRAKTPIVFQAADLGMTGAFQFWPLGTLQCCSGGPLREIE